MDTALQQLIDAVKSVAPQLWDIYLRQVTVQAWGFTIGAVLVLLVTLAFLWALRNEFEGEAGALAFIAFLGFGLCGILAYSAFGRFFNPPYYAIQLLISSATGR